MWSKKAFLPQIIIFLPVQSRISRFPALADGNGHRILILQVKMHKNKKRPFTFEVYEIPKAHSILAVANLLPHNNTSQISLLGAAVNCSFSGNLYFWGNIYLTGNGTL